tara:strand:- start:166 stop:330 length:165 start_codon:yes stop_codon:yes gene_type:complete
MSYREYLHQKIKNLKNKEQGAQEQMELESAWQHLKQPQSKRNWQQQTMHLIYGD